MLIEKKIVGTNVNPRKPKPRSLPTEVSNKKHLAKVKREHRHRMLQKSEFHKQRAKEEFPMSDHPSLQHLLEKE